VVIRQSDELCKQAKTDNTFEILTVECCYLCTTELNEPFQSLLLVFAFSDWLIARNLGLG